MPALFLILMDGTIRQATALVLPALGELLMERSGVLNIGLEGCMLWGAFAGLVGTLSWGPQAGLACGLVAGVANGVVFGWLTALRKTNAIVAGMAVNLLALGGTGFLYRLVYGKTGTGASVELLPKLGAWAGPLANQTWMPLAAVLLAWLLQYGLTRTYWGVGLRACGGNPAAARMQGVPVAALRFWACIIGSGLAGVGGAFLVVGSTGVFVERMTAGRGFMALAIVILGRWNAWGVCAAAVMFGGAVAAQFAVQAMATGIAYQWFLMLPYVITLATLALTWFTRGEGRAMRRGH